LGANILQAEKSYRKTRLFGQIFVGLEVSNAKLKMVWTEVNESRAVFIKPDVFLTFNVEQATVDTIEKTNCRTPGPITSVHWPRLLSVTKHCHATFF
jgi:hypothetical protein